MDTHKYVVVVCLDESVVAFLDKNNKENFDVDIRNIFDECFEYFLLAHPLEYILEGNLVENVQSTMVI